jgi:hypothetical protein
MTLKQAPTFNQVYEELFQILHRSSEPGCCGTLANCLFEPPNPFDPDQRRKPRPELLILLSYVGLMAATFVMFNLW